MRLTTAILSALILASFFMPFIELHTEMFGYSHTETQTLFEFSRIHTAVAWLLIIPLLSPVTMAIALIKSKYYSWLAFYLAIITAYAAIVIMLAARTNNVQMEVGFVIFLLSSVTLFVISLIDIISNARSFKILILIHLFILLFIPSLGIAASVEDLSSFIACLIVIGLPIGITLAIATLLYPQLKLEKNRKIIYIICGIAGIVIIFMTFLKGGTTTNDTKKQPLAEASGDIKADTCIYLSQDKAVFIEGIKNWGEEVQFHLVVKKKNKWDPFFTIKKAGPYLFSGKDLSIEKLGDKEYFYLMYHSGGGSIGNDYTEFSLYEWDGDRKEHTLIYEYYPDNVSSMSELTFNEDPKTNPILTRFLKTKVRNNKYYVQDSFWEFTHRFCTDRNFQLSRIKFPLYRWVPVSDPAQIDDTCIKDEMEGYLKKVAINSSDWKILDESSLDAYQDLQKYYGAKWQKISAHERCLTIGAIDSDVDRQYFFERLKGEWYLTGIQ